MTVFSAVIFNMDMYFSFGFVSVDFSISMGFENDNFTIDVDVIFRSRRAAAIGFMSLFSNSHDVAPFGVNDLGDFIVEILGNSLRRSSELSVGAGDGRLSSLSKNLSEDGFDHGILDALGEVSSGHLGNLLEFFFIAG
mmetsp:Transcript_34212/g.33420  ORF Transcript_34212/g.33420 Transcript_34212/m.33420 type:complete len:138 (-) Transcript_34212:646-1059(-)